MQQSAHQSRFLEAPLVWQAESKFKINCLSKMQVQQNILLQKKMSSIVKSILQIEFTPGRILYATQIVRVHVSNILLQEGCTNSNYPPQIWTCSFIYVQKKLVSVQKQVYYNNLCSEICWIINSLLYKKEMFLDILAFYASSLNSGVCKLWNFWSSVFISFVTKGQTISEEIYEVIVSPKIRTKNCQDFWPV